MGMLLNGYDTIAFVKNLLILRIIIIISSKNTLHTFK